MTAGTAPSIVTTPPVCACLPTIVGTPEKPKLVNSAECITELAHRLRCDRILMGTVRKDSLVRLVEDCVVNRVLELTTVPVEVIAGASVSKWERYGIPAAVGALLAIALAD